MEVLASHGLLADEQRLVEALQVSERYYEERYWTDDTFWASENEARRMWVELYSLLARELGAKDAQALGEVLYEEFGKGSRWALYEDVIPAMRALKEMGVLMGVVSNWDARLAGLCLELDLSPFLHFVVSSACVGRIKPEPSIFRMALERAGVEASRALHVGDHSPTTVSGWPRFLPRPARRGPLLRRRAGCKGSGSHPRVAEPAGGPSPLRLPGHRVPGGAPGAGETPLSRGAAASAGWAPPLFIPP